MVCVHWALSELLAAAARAKEPEWTGLETTLSSGEQVHGDREPDSKPGLATRLPPAGVGVGGGGGAVGVGVGVGVCVGVGVGGGVGVAVRVGVAVGVGVGVPPPPPSVARCGPTAPEKALPLDASQLMDHVIA